MNWLIQIENELRRVRPGENPGRTRTIARRASGIALKHYYKEQTDDVIGLLRRASSDDALPEVVRQCATQLHTRLSADFTSASVDPICEANTIITFIKNQMIGNG